MINPPPAIIQLDLGPEAAAAGIRGACTTVAAGNYGLDVEDDPGTVHARRTSLRAWAGQPVQFSHHVHGTDVCDATAQHPSEPVGDAWVSNASAAFSIQTADCVPVLAFDSRAGVIGAAHAGRIGIKAGVIPQMIERMHALGAASISAIIGPAICGQCYEAPAGLAEEFLDHGLPTATTSWGTPSLDLPAGAAQQLQSAQVQVHSLEICTYTDERFFSHRSSDRMDGRFVSLLSLI